MKIFKTFFNGIPQFVLSLLLIGFVGLTLAAQNSEDEVSVPKGIQDIVLLIKNSAVETKTRQADIKLVSEQASSKLANQEKYAFYYLQSLAAERLGRIDLRVDFLKKALEFAKERTHQEFVIVGELASAEI